MNQKIEALDTDHMLKKSSVFVENQGQEDERALFVAQIQGRRVFFSDDRITFVEIEGSDLSETSDGSDTNGVKNGVSLELSFIGTSSQLTLNGVSPLPGYHHYLKGAEANQWIRDVVRYESLFYQSVWEGVHLEAYNSDAGLKMNWLLDRPDKVSLIELSWAGADRLELDEEGNMLIHHVLGTMTDMAPFAYQEINGEKIPVTCTYRFTNGFSFGFEVTGEYDSEAPLVIDPVNYTTYLGTSSTTQGKIVAVDTAGCTYVVGSTNALDFPTTPGAFQTENTSQYSAFITKFAADGASLVYSTYLGGSGFQYGLAAALAAGNQVFITGSTTSSDFPVTPGAYQTTMAGSVAAFVTKLAADGGSLIYSTYLGGNNVNQGYGIAVDLAGDAYVMGNTTATDFPVTANAFQTALAGVRNLFVSKLAIDGSSLIYSTYLGGAATDTAKGIALDAQNCAYVAGATSSSNFPTTAGAFLTAYPGGTTAGYVTKLAADGESLVYSSYLGGSNEDAINSIAVDSKNQACVTGDTRSYNFPVTPGAFQTTRGGPDFTVFVTKFTSDGADLAASTYLGGNTSTMLSVQQIFYYGERGYSITVDQYDQVYLTGITFASDFPITPEVIPSAYGGGEGDGFISIFSADLSDLRVSYYIGGLQEDQGFGIAVGGVGIVYSTGSTRSENFPVTPGAFQENFGSSVQDGYLTKATFSLPLYSRASLVLEKLL